MKKKIGESTIIIKKNNVKICFSTLKNYLIASTTKVWDAYTCGV